MKLGLFFSNLSCTEETFLDSSCVEELQKDSFGLKGNNFVTEASILQIRAVVQSARDVMVKQPFLFQFCIFPG